MSSAYPHLQQGISNISGLVGVSVLTNVQNVLQSVEGVGLERPIRIVGDTAGGTYFWRDNGATGHKVTNFDNTGALGSTVSPSGFLEALEIIADKRAGLTADYRIESGPTGGVAMWKETGANPYRVAKINDIGTLYEIQSLATKEAAGAAFIVLRDIEL
jgi:hypothetical protein